MSKKFASATKMNYSRGLKGVNVNAPGSTFYSSLYGNSLQLNRIYGFLKNNPKKGPNPPPPPVFDTKIAAILDFNDTVYDQPIIKTLNYYFDTVPRFVRFPIVNSEGKTDKLISLLDEYYDKGFRYFLTATLTPTLISVIDWFNFHPEAQGVSSASRLFSLSIPKSIFRMQYPNLMETTSREIVGNNYDSIFYIYNTNQNTAYWNTYLSDLCNERGLPYYSWPVSNISIITDTNFVNDKMAEINSIIEQNGYNNASVTVGLVNFQDAYYNKFVFGITPTLNKATCYNINVFIPKINEINAQTYFLNVPLYAQTVGNLGSSPLWRKGETDLGVANFSQSTLNAIELLYKLDIANGYSSEIGAYSDSLIFNIITRDQIYESYVYNLYGANNQFTPSIIYFRSDNGIIFKAVK